MPEHFTKNTLTATVWCNKCGRNTDHRIDDGRRGPCLEHSVPIKTEKKAPPDTQEKLFETE